jgi:hypothetical protein
MIDDKLIGIIVNTGANLRVALFYIALKLELKAMTGFGF